MDINQAIICGRIISEPNYSHQVNDEHFNKFFVGVERGNGIEDSIPIIANVGLMQPTNMKCGEFVRVTGQYRSHTDAQGHKSVFVLARSVALCSECYENSVCLCGTICQSPCYRALPTGKEITGLCVANNQNYGKSYYLPVIVWDKFAKEVSGYNVGDMIECKGRIQSRSYPKEGRLFYVYEMNVSSIDKITDNK